MASIDMSDKTIAEKTREKLLQRQPKRWPVYLDGSGDVCVRYYGFKNLAEFIRSPVSQNGLGMDLKKAKTLLKFNEQYKERAERVIAKLELSEQAKAVEEAKQHGTNQHKKGGLDHPRNVKSSKAPPSEVGGNSSAYRISVLKRDHPEVAARLEAGEFKTVAEAQRAAGVKEPRRKLLGRFSWFEGDTQGFVDDIKERLGPELVAELKRLL